MVTVQERRNMSEQAKQQKQVIIDEIKEKLDGAQSAVLVDYMGITVAEADAMRTKLREAEVDYSVYKNTLMKRAVSGTEFEKLSEVMQGPSAIAISKTDATAPARVLKNLIDDFKKMELKAGVVEGEFYDNAGIVQIAEIPSRDELIAKFMGSIRSPVGTFVRTLSAIAEAKPADGAEAPSEEAKAETEAAPVTDETETGDAAQEEGTADAAPEAEASDAAPEA